MPMTIVDMNIIEWLKSGFSGATNPLKAIGKLNIIPMTSPCSDQCFKERALMPIANPIKVLLVMICSAIGNASFSEPLEASP